MDDQYYKPGICNTCNKAKPVIDVPNKERSGMESICKACFLDAKMRGQVYNKKRFNQDELDEDVRNASI